MKKNEIVVSQHTNDQGAKSGVLMRSNGLKSSKARFAIGGIVLLIGVFLVLSAIL